LESGFITFLSLTGGVVKIALLSVNGVSNTGILSATEFPCVESVTGLVLLLVLQEIAGKTISVIKT
jgi:hypothetical protein